MAPKHPASDRSSVSSDEQLPPAKKVKGNKGKARPTSTNQPASLPVGPPADDEQQDPSPQVVLDTFGHIAEGYQFTNALPAERQRQLEKQFLLRRLLAEYARFPEGFGFLNILEDGTERQVHLLTPPEMVAVLQQDGSWIRRARNNATDPPAPYDRAWYRGWLQEHGLPAWFMTLQHLVLLESDHEATAVQVEHEEKAFEPPSTNYMEQRFPETPAFPFPWLVGIKPYIFQPTNEIISQLARRFPAMLQQRREGYLVVVLPSGHVVFRDRREVDNLPRAKGKVTMMSEEQVRKSGALRLQTLSFSLASYVIETANTTVTEPIDTAATKPAGAAAIESTANAATAQTGTGMIKPTNTPVTQPAVPTAASISPGAHNVLVVAAEAAGWTVNPGYVLNGRGEWRWLRSDVDRPHALGLGYNDEVAVTRARERGELLQGTGSNAGPFVAFRPDSQYRNLTARPQGPGWWVYQGQGDTDLAAINYGGNADLGFANGPPSAGELFALRRQMAADGRPGFAAEIEIIWDPDAVRPAATQAAAATPATAPVAIIGNVPDVPAPVPPTTAPTTPAASVTEPAQDQSPGAASDQFTEELPHDPTNGKPGDAQWDQTTTDDPPAYQTINVNGRDVTMDRGRATVGKVEPHKLYIYTKGGYWLKWSGWPSKDLSNKKAWNNAKLFKNFNAWRDQTASRNGWPKKRPQKRADYSKEMEKFLWDYMRFDDHGDVEVTKSIAAITAEFNKRWSLRRQQTAIGSKFTRLKTSYKKKNGAYAPTDRPRGWKQKQQKERRLRGEDDDESEDQEQEDEDKDKDDDSDDDEEKEGEGE